MVRRRMYNDGKILTGSSGGNYDLNTWITQESSKSCSNPSSGLAHEYVFCLNFLIRNCRLKDDRFATEL